MYIRSLSLSDEIENACRLLPEHLEVSPVAKYDGFVSSKIV